MWCIKSFGSILALMAMFLLCPAGVALQAFSGDAVSIDHPVADDIIAGGNVVNINAPVDSAIVAAGTVSINAPVKGDVIAAGGQVYVNSDVGGKVVVAGGNVNLGGSIGTNLVAAGGQINILPGKTINRDALIGGGQVVNAGRINGTLIVSASQFNNTGTATAVKFHKVEDSSPKEKNSEMAGSLFYLMVLFGYLIMGLLLVKYLPGIFRVVDGEIRISTLPKTLLGFVMIISAIIAIILVAVTVVGMPIAMVSLLLFIAALMLSGTFVSYSLGRWINEKARIKQGDLISFVIGFIVLNLLTHLPLVGVLVSLVSMSLGLSALLYAALQLSRMNRPQTA